LKICPLDIRKIFLLKGVFVILSLFLSPLVRGFWKFKIPRRREPIKVSLDFISLFHLQPVTCTYHLQKNIDCSGNFIYNDPTMKIKKHILIIVIVMITMPCIGKIKKVPEISSSLIEETVLELRKDENTAEKIIENNSELVFITLKGKIYRFNPSQKIVNFLYNLTTDIEAEIVHQKDIIILKKKDSKDVIVFDLKQMKVIKTLENLKTEKIVTIDNEIMGYKHKNQLIFLHYPSGKTLEKLKIDADIVFYNSESVEGEAKTFILSSDNLYVYKKRQNSIEIIDLKYKPTSDFLMDGNYIYYGAKNRNLIKFSLTSNKVKWKFRIAEQLKLRPQKVGPYIAITPEDNNIYFFNKRGTLYWWEKLDSSRLLPPVAMGENMAVFLWDKTFKFFNYKKKQVVSYPFDKASYSNILYIDNYLYLVSQEETDEDRYEQPPKSITKIGNNFGVAIRTKPQHVLPLGKSIKFNLIKFNLIKPELKIKILNPAGKSLFDKTVSHKENPSFVWIPNKAVEYKLVIEINAKNKKDLRIEETFFVTDVEKILNQYYYRLQKNSKADQVASNPSPLTLTIKKDGKTKTILGREKD
jgi:hypothetical protein